MKLVPIYDILTLGFVFTLPRAIGACMFMGGKCSVKNYQLIRSCTFKLLALIYLLIILAYVHLIYINKVNEFYGIPVSWLNFIYLSLDVIFTLTLEMHFYKVTKYGKDYSAYEEKLQEWKRKKYNIKET